MDETDCIATGCRRIFVRQYARERRVLRKLSDDEIADLVRRYRDGASTYELAERFGVHRVTVSAHLHRQGAKMRGTSLTAEQVDQEVRLYQDGWSTARIGRHLDFNGDTVWLALRARGVRMRDSHGRER